MKLLTITNLYARPDKPTHGTYNVQLFDQFAAKGRMAENWCLVPQFNPFRWPAVRRWRNPLKQDFPTRYQPVWYLPGVGRNVADVLYYQTLRRSAVWPRGVGCIYATWLYPDGAAAARLALRMGVPWALMVQGSDVRHLEASWRRAAILRALAGASAVICVSANLRDALLAAGTNGGNIHVVPNGVDASRFAYRDRDAARRELGLPCDARVVLFVGHLWPVKTVDVLIRALPQLRAAVGSSLHVAILGDGPSRAGLETLAEHLGVSECTAFHGEAPHAQVPLWMNAADCLCLCSRSEGMPSVVIEAVVSGLPVVAADVGACREILAEEPGGTIVPPGDSVALATALAAALNRRIDRRAMAGRHARRFNWERQAGLILELLDGKPRL